MENISIAMQVSLQNPNRKTFDGKFSLKVPLWEDMSLIKEIFLCWGVPVVKRMTYFQQLRRKRLNVSCPQEMWSWSFDRNSYKRTLSRKLKTWMFLLQVSMLADFKKCSLLSWTLLSWQFCTFFFSEQVSGLSTQTKKNKILCCCISSLYPCGKPPGFNQGMSKSQLFIRSVFPIVSHMSEWKGTGE